jgi:FG-GAP-like repeat
MATSKDKKENLYLSQEMFIKMKNVYVVILIILYACSKTKDMPQEAVPANIPPANTPINTTAPTTYDYKNLKNPSYETQNTPINEDILNIVVNTKNSLGQSASEIINKGISASAISYLDFNGDGLLDFYVHPVTNLSFQGKEKVAGQVYLNVNGKYIYDENTIDTAQIPKMYLARKSIVGDFNNDARPDLFLAGFGMDQSPFLGEANALILSIPNGKYKKIEFNNNIGVFHSVCSGDIDKDGDLDIFALANDKSYFLINDGKGNFTITTNNINIASLGSLFTSELYDINKDGYIDLILGGHEFSVKDTSFKIATEYEGATRIYWGNSNYKYNEENVTYLPVNSYFGVVLDFDFADLDGDGKLEIAINRTGGRLVNNVLTDFYKNWAIQILKFDGTKWLDKTGAFIEAGMDLTVSKGPTWMKFYNKNDRLYYESLNINGDPLLQWVWENKKLKRLK